MVLQTESTKSYSEPNKEKPTGAVPVQSPEEKAQDSHSNRDPYTPEERQGLLVKPLTYTTKVEAIKVLTNLPPTTTALHVQLERHLGHRPEDLPLPKEVGQALSQALEERRTMVNTFLQNGHYAGGIHRNMLRLMKHRIRQYTTYKHQVKRLYLTAVRGPVPRHMSRWKAKGLQILQRRQLWLDDYVGTKELLFKATAVHTMQVYTERCFSDWQHHIKHALNWWSEHKRDWYENRVTQMNTPGAESATDPGTRKYSGQTSAHVHDGHISASCTQQRFSLLFQHRMLNNN